MIKEDETIAQYVERRIHDIFLEIAEICSEDDLGVHPMAIFQGETLLINVWRQYVEKEMV